MNASGCCPSDGEYDAAQSTLQGSAEADTPSDAKESHPCGYMEYPNRVPGWQGCHCLYNLSVLGLAETRWTQLGEAKLASGESIIYSGHEDEGTHHTEGVAIMMEKDARKALTAWKNISSRLISASFKTKNRRVKAHIIQCYVKPGSMTA